MQYHIESAKGHRKMTRFPFLSKNPHVVRHSSNQIGRDFIVGDLHGCCNLLDAMLEKVSFDTANDRLFSTGDLVDRGPHSEKCLELLKEPWFYATLGNHDAMLIAWIFGNGMSDTRRRNYENAFTSNKGWKWVKQFYRASEFLPLLENLPFIQVIGDGSERFQVVHAELIDFLKPTDEHDELQGLSDKRIDHLTNDDWDIEHFVEGYDRDGSWTDHLLWGRSIITGFKDQLKKVHKLGFPPIHAKGFSKTYVGHSILPLLENSPIMIYSHVFMDTGAYYSQDNARFGLTLWNHTENHGLFLAADGSFTDLKGNFDGNR